MSNKGTLKFGEIYDEKRTHSSAKECFKIFIGYVNYSDDGITPLFFL